MYRLLIVEDDKGIAEAIKNQAEMWELQVHCIENFRNVMTEFAEFDPHIILLDMAGIDNSAILLKSDYQFKGPLTENFVLQQLCGQYDVAPHYYSERSGEIDFVVQHGIEIIPIEAKGGEYKSAPTFKRYISEHQPKYAVRFSKRGYRKDGYITNMPLYLARKMKELL